MLIVSQDRERIINLDRVEEIAVLELGVPTPTIRAFFRVFFDEEAYSDIADFKTKDRAMEVLADLAAAHEHGAKVFEMSKE